MNRIAEFVDSFIPKNIPKKKALMLKAELTCHIIDKADFYKDVTHRDLVKYGIIPELVGRIPVITALSGMNKEALIRIMTEPKNSIIKQYKALFTLDGVELVFEDEALEKIAELTIERKTGARGLRSIIEAILKQPMYDIPSEDGVERIIITAQTVSGGEPKKVLKQKKSNKKLEA